MRKIFSFFILALLVTGTLLATPRGRIGCDLQAADKTGFSRRGIQRKAVYRRPI